MMKKVFVITLLSSMLGLTLHAGEGHVHGPGGHTHSHGPIKEQSSKQAVLASANQHIKQLIKNSKIDKSWEGVSPAKTEQKRFNATLEWVVTYKNTNVTDPTKQNLYVFVDLYGKVKAANHTGK